MIAIRAAGPGDLKAVTAFHVRMWRATYRDMAPAEAWHALDENRRRPGWQARLREVVSGNGTLLACDGNDLAGLICFGPASHAELRPGAEIHHLYVDPHWGRQGIGRRLLTLAFGQLRAAGHDRASLAVVTQNYEARAFYRALGGTETGCFTDPGPLWRSENTIIRWPLTRP